MFLILFFDLILSHNLILLLVCYEYLYNVTKSLVINFFLNAFRLFNSRLMQMQDESRLLTHELDAQVICRFRRQGGEG